MRINILFPIVIILTFSVQAFAQFNKVDTYSKLKLSDDQIQTINLGNVDQNNVLQYNLSYELQSLLSIASTLKGTLTNIQKRKLYRLVRKIHRKNATSNLFHLKDKIFNQ